MRVVAGRIVDSNGGVQRVESLRMQVAQQLRRRIRAGRFSMGERVTEKAVASLLDVSRTPAREALGLLGESGFLEVLPNGGYMVPFIEEEDIIDIFFVRTQLEVPAVRLAVKNAERSDVDRLEEMIAVISKAAKSDDPDSFLELVMEFRKNLFELSGNRHLASSIIKLDSLTECIKLFAMADISVRKTAVSAYRALIDAIENGDSRAAVAIIKEHHEHGIDSYNNALAEFAAKSTQTS